MTTLILLRLVHVVFGALWVGMVVFTTFFLAPAVQDTGPDGGKVMAALQRRGISPRLQHRDDRDAAVDAAGHRARRVTGLRDAARAGGADGRDAASPRP